MDFLGGGVRIPKTAEIVANRIRKSIIKGELKPNDRLPPESNLMQEFGVSRPTIREAIRILEWEDMISVSRGARGGAKVNAHSSLLVTRAAGVALQAKRATLRDVYEVRSLIEPPAARMAAERRPKQAAQALGAHMRIEWWSWEDRAARAKAIAAFHQTLLEECSSPTLAVMGIALQEVVAKHLELSNVEKGRTRDTAPDPKTGFRSHERLVELIEQGDGAGAEAHWQRHMAAAGVHWLKSMASKSVIDILD